MTKEFTLRTPDAPASTGQLIMLHFQTKEDTRGWTLTMKQASDTIRKLKAGKKVDLSSFKPKRTRKNTK